MILSTNDIDTVWNSWIATGFAPWRDANLSPEDVAARLDLDYHSDGAFCYFRIENGVVEIDPVTVEERPYMLDLSHTMGLRAHFFLALLRDTVRMFKIRGSARICLFVADEYVVDLRGPVFFFQKPLGARALLLPDIDLIILGYCADSDGRFGDPIAWDDKQQHAIFVGSTTGSAPLTARHVHERTNPRIRAATFFLGRDDVTFELPNICQEDNEDTRSLIESLNIGGPNRSWAEQQKSRYQISIDGNGATCARVAISLHSHSVLMKYNSHNILYYFQGLEPWRHYIPVSDDLNILRALEDAQHFSKLHRDIAERSRIFAQQFLTRHAIFSYTARLLQSYINAYGTGGGELGDRRERPFIDSRTHLQGLGDHYTDFEEWNGADARGIEGFALIPANGIIADQLRYSAIAEDGREFHVENGGLYCGTRGASLTLRGMTAQLHNGPEEQYKLTIYERFADGAERVTIGGAGLVAHTAPLVSFRVDLTPIQEVSAKKWWQFHLQR